MFSLRSKARKDALEKIFLGFLGIGKKIPNPKYRLYGCLIECIDWRMEIQSVMLVFSTPILNLRPSTFSPVHPLPLPCVNKYRSIQSIQGITEGVADQVV
jgi:hypothetical protein